MPDLEQLRKNSSFLNFKDLKETVIPQQKLELVKQKDQEFEMFGDIDES